MLKQIHSAGARAYQSVEAVYNRAFGNEWNPFYHLGAMTVFFFWIVLVSGIYVFIFFETSVYGAWQSMEYITHDQWYLAGVMRSLHRYASDGAIITIGLHIVREFSKDRYRGKRWFSWFTGVPLLWMVFPLGITGYWMVWDELAQYVAVISSELMDWLPVLGGKMARNFLSPDSLNDRFFTLMAFIHVIGLPIFLLFGIWFHVLRITSPKVNPPRGLMAGTLLALLVLSLVKPAVSHPEADLSIVPGTLSLDWFYLMMYPLADEWDPAWVWGLMFGVSIFLTMLPWLPPKRDLSLAVVDLENCNGCGRCVDDCPYSAVTMMPRSDGLKFEKEAVVNADLCTGCGICVGACPTATPHRRKSALIPGIDLDHLPIRDIREQVIEASARLRGDDRVLVFGCNTSPKADQLQGEGVAVIKMPCVGMLPPAFMDYVISKDLADGVMLAGCRNNDCHFRMGIEWTEKRIAGKRDPYLRKRVPLERINRCWVGDYQENELARQVEVFRANLRGYGPLAKTADLKQEHAITGAEE